MRDSLWLLTLAVACSGSPAVDARSKGRSMDVNLTLERTELASGDDLAIEVVVTNHTGQPVRLNTMTFGYPSLVLRVRDGAGNRVPLGPPPTPWDDDGESDRQTLAPGASARFAYRKIFGSAPPPGDYEVAFQAELRKGPTGRDWEGKLASEWVRFHIR